MGEMSVTGMGEMSDTGMGVMSVTGMGRCQSRAREGWQSHDKSPHRAASHTESDNNDSDTAEQAGP